MYIKKLCKEIRVSIILFVTKYMYPVSPSNLKGKKKKNCHNFFFLPYINKLPKIEVVYTLKTEKNSEWIEGK